MVLFFLLFILILITLSFSNHSITKNDEIKQLVKIKRTFNNILKVHPNWSKENINDIKRNLNKLEPLNDNEINNVLLRLKHNAYSKTKVNIRKFEHEDGLVTYSVHILKKESKHMYNIDLGLYYKKKNNDDELFYNTTKSYIMLHTDAPMYFYKQSIYFVKKDEITVKCFIYFKKDNNTFVEVPLTIKAYININELKKREGNLTYTLG